MKTDIEVELTLKLDPAHFWTLYGLLFDSAIVDKHAEKTVVDQIVKLKERLEQIGFDEDWYKSRPWL